MPPTTDQVGKLSVACKDLLIMALNPIQTKINRLQTTYRKNLWILFFFSRVVISAGDEFSLNLLVHMEIHKRSLICKKTKKKNMPVPIVFFLIRSYLVNWPFYLSVFCVNEWYGPAPELLILTSIVRLPCYILWPYNYIH